MRTAFRTAQAALVAAAASRLLAAQEPPPAPVRPAPPAVVAPAAPPPSNEPPRSLLLDDAEAALRAGRTEQAVQMAERYTARNFRDPRGYLVLGNAYMSRAPSGRSPALRAYEEAIRLAPVDPEPPYLYAQAGMWLGGNEGEAIARRGLEKVLELDPLYGLAWTRWLTAFRNSDSRRRMRERLVRHESTAEVRARIAYLYLEDEQYPQADSLLDELIARDSTNVEWLAWRAQSAFEVGDTARGTELYVRALTNAQLDSTEALWRQAIGIAHPDEIRSWQRVSPDRKGQWLAAFWARRTPNLFGATNARLVEHFQRLRYARRNYPLLHPLVTYHSSRAARATNPEPTRAEREFYRRCEVTEPLAPVNRAGALPDSEVQPPAALRMYFAPLGTDPAAVDSAEARGGLNLVTGLDDRGLLYLRFGAPARQALGGRNTFDPQCRARDLELWYYDDIGSVRFARPSALVRDAHGLYEMVFRVANDGEREGMRAGLTLDAPSQPAPLEFTVWTAQFSGGRAGITEIAAVASRGALAASLVSGDGAGEVRRGGSGWVILESPAGGYMLLAHARDSSRLGRQQLSVEMRPFLAAPALSDILVAPAWPAANPSRYDMLRHVSRTRTLPEGAALRSYAEVTGLVPDGSVVRYRAEYALLRSDDPERDQAREQWPDAPVEQFAFDRESQLTAAGTAREVLDITPERLAPGRYVLRLRIRDLVGGGTAARAQTAFTVR